MSRKLMLVSLLSVGAMWGCGGAEPDTQGAGGAGSGSGGGSAATTGSGGEAGAGGNVTCAPSAADEPDPEGVDTNCDGADGSVGTDVYVDGALGSDTNPGTPVAPLRTLPNALALAQARKAHVLLANGDYTLSKLSTSGDYTVHGGYPKSFLGSRKRELTVLQAETAAGISIENAGTVHLESLTIQGLDATDELQSTAHALALEVTEAQLVDVEVISGDGLPGANGEEGIEGESGKNAIGKYGTSGLTCDGALQPTFSNGAQAGSPNGQGGPAGNCTLKLPATTGKPGLPGSSGVNAASLPVVSSGFVSWPNGSDGTDGQPGFGGAGGGICSPGATSGGGATGGCPGKPGAGGASGGGSVAILLLSGSLTLENSRVRTGYAGNGGDGGKGGKAGKGGLGAKPSCGYGIDCTKLVEVCVPASDPYKMGCALYGGAGGPGGDGGHGGAGTGGWTIGVVNVAGTTVTIDSGSDFELGITGKGGEGDGGVRAPDGQKRKVLELTN